MTQARTLADFVSGTTTITGNPTFSGTVAGAGAMSLVHSSTATSGTTLDFTGATTAFQVYYCIYAIDPTNDGGLTCQFYDAGGTPSLLTTSDYSQGGVNEGGGQAPGNAHAQTDIEIRTGIGGASSGEYYSGSFFFQNPMDSVYFTQIHGINHGQGTSNVHVWNVYGGQKAALEQNKGFQLQLTAGTITSAYLKVFGIEG